MFIQLYYSKSCKLCIDFMNIINNEKLDKFFSKIDIEQLSSKQLFELRLKIVPAVIIISKDNPQPTVLQGSTPCFNWLNGIIQNRRENMSKYVDQQRKLIQEQYVAQKKAQGDYATGFVAEEMDGISDGYAYTDIDMHQSKSFVPHGQEHLYNIVTPQYTDSKISEFDLKKQMSLFENQRSTDTEQFKQLMEKNQIEAILNTKYNSNLM